MWADREQRRPAVLRALLTRKFGWPAECAARWFCGHNIIVKRSGAKGAGVGMSGPCAKLIPAQQRRFIDWVWISEHSEHLRIRGGVEWKERQNDGDGGQFSCQCCGAAHYCCRSSITTSGCAACATPTDTAAAAVAVACSSLARPSTSPRHDLHATHEAAVMSRLEPPTGMSTLTCCCQLVCRPSA